MRVIFRVNELWRERQVGRASLSLATGLFLLLIAGFITQVGAWVMSANVDVPWLGYASDYLAGVAMAGLLAVLVFVVPLRERDRLPFFLVWIAKSSVVLGFMLVYESHYDFLDAYSYHKLARFGDYTTADLYLGSGTETITYVLQLLYAVLPSSYHMAKVIFAFIGLVGVYLAYRGWVIYTGDRSRRVFLILALFPGLLFWSSILGKDPLLVLAIGLFTYGLSTVFIGRGARGFFIVACAILLAGAIRPWMAIVLSTTLGVSFAVSAHGLKKGLVLIVVPAALIALFGSYVLSMLNLETINQISRGWSEGGAAQVVPEFTSYTQVITFLPVGAFTALFRPLPGEVMNMFGLLASIENSLLLGMLVWGSFYWERSLLRDRLYVTLFALVFIWAMVYGFASYQNLGTAVRFKAQILPALLIVLWWPFWHRTRARQMIAASG